MKNHPVEENFLTGKNLGWGKGNCRQTSGPHN